MTKEQSLADEIKDIIFDDYTPYQEIDLILKAIDSRLAEVGETSLIPKFSRKKGEPLSVTAYRLGYSNAKSDVRKELGL